MSVSVSPFGLSQGAAWVMGAFGGNVCSIGFFWSRIAAQANLFAAYANPSAPLVFTKLFVSHAQKAGRFFCGWGESLILSIYRNRHIAQVRKPVVESVAVNVINNANGPHLVYKKHGQSMRSIIYFVDAYRRVSLVVDAACKLPRGRVANMDLPSKKPGGFAIVQHFAKSLVSDNWLSHDASFSLIGQRPASTRNAERASLF